MGKLIVEQLVTADGYAEDSDGGMKFVEHVADDPEVVRTQLAVLSHVDAVLLGANTYRLFIGMWPTTSAEDNPVAGPINTLPKHIVSSTLDAAPWGEWKPATLERGDGVEIARRLKRQYDGDVIVWGSLTLANALFEGGVVDVLRVRVVPALIGSGRRITPEGLDLTRLRLTSTHAHPLGQVALQYDVR